TSFFFCAPVAVKRLMKEAAELRDPTEHYHAQPLEDNLFEWHFSVRGPPDSEFDGGVYHGRIVLPPDYPMKPPSIILLTSNGRFEVGKKICLSISSCHPSKFISLSVRTALIAIIGFMPTKGEGAIGSLDYTPEERKSLAKKSQDFHCEACGCTMRTALMPLTSNSNPSQEDKEAKELAKQINFKAESSTSSTDAQSPGAESSPTSGTQAQALSSGTQAAAAAALPEAEQKPCPSSPFQAAPQSDPTEEPPQPSRRLSPRQRRAQQPRRPASPAFAQIQRRPADAHHTGSAVLIVLLTLALAALIFRRIYLANEYKLDYEL
uniref:Ubiquitin-conjugating enzyme E2 J1 n=1 Tax=Lepisosteus oculatus TaxID=7918 RepID=W5NJY4_LEPOC